MTRKPKARQKVLDASREIVADRGAGCLTFDEIAAVSGVTRGGITYHFPTKQKLLQALVEDDFVQWQQLEAELRPKGLDDETAETIAFIRSWTNENQERRRLVAGMLTAVTHDPPILDPVRDFEEERLSKIQWTPTKLRLELLRLAAGGLFWADLFGCPSVPKDLRKQLVAELESLARQWSEPAEPTDEK